MNVTTQNQLAQQLLAYLRKWRPRSLTATPGLTGLAVITALIWTAIFSLPDRRLHLYFLDIGQGDGILIQTPSGRQVLIDGGTGGEALLNELGETLPFWDRNLDMVLLTHPDRDHIGGQIRVPERFAVEYALNTPISHADDSALAEDWRNAFAGTRLMQQTTGGWIDLGDGVALWVLWPPPEGIDADDWDNENSLVTKLVYGDFSVLLTGDAGVASEAAWVAAGLPLTATVLKVGHHGSDGSTSAALVEAVDPDYAVIQVGASNSYGHPAPSVLDLLADADAIILRNDQDGRIHMSSDGSQLWVETER